MYILIEGIDTSGKSTQAQLLYRSYPDAILTKEPGGCRLGEEIREMILHKGVESKTAELFLFLADRAEHFETVIKPNLDRIIISDRGLVSGIAYALANGSPLSRDQLIDLNRLALDNHLPDKVVLLETDETVLGSRMKQKAEDKIEQRGIDYLLEVQHHMKEVIAHLKIPHHSIPANLPIEEIHRHIKEFIDD